MGWKKLYYLLGGALALYSSDRCVVFRPRPTGRAALPFVGLERVVVFWVVLAGMRWDWMRWGGGEGGCCFWVVG